MNLLRQKIENKEKVRGTLTCLTDPCLCEIVGNAGFDCVWIDREHTHISNEQTLSHLNAARASGIAAVVRVPQNDLTVTKQVLEMGPDGIIFPMVHNAEEAKALIDMTLYPPLGNRGFGPMRAIGYGSMDAKEYTDRKSLEMCRLMQIEHVECVENLEEIFTVPYIDGFIFGPNDLSGSVGEMLDIFGEATVTQIEKAVKILKKHGKYFGVACGTDEKVLRFWSQFEPDMIFAGADWCFLYAAGCETLNKIKKIL